MDLTEISKIPLFAGFTGDELEEFFDVYAGNPVEYEKNGVILRAGEVPEGIELILSGSANIETSNIWGQRNIITHISAGDIFAEAYAILDDEHALVSVTASEPTSVVTLRVMPLLLGEKASPSEKSKNQSYQPNYWPLTTPPPSQTYPPKLITNLLRILSMKNLEMSKRMLHTTPKTIRARVLAYLSEQALRANSRDFTIPFDRQELADHLGVDRSSLSAELSALKRDGIIDCRKNHFRLLGDRVEE